MAAYKDVVLQSIGPVRVYRPPNMKINRLVSAKYHYPPQPTITIEQYRGKNQPKEEAELLAVEGPEYDAWKGECDALDQQRYAEINDYTYLYSLKDVKVPDWLDADAEFGEFARMIDASWQPRQGPQGRKLDYLEWVVLGLADDAVVVSEALDELLGISQEVVEDVKNSFQREMAETAS